MCITSVETAPSKNNNSNEIILIITHLPVITHFCTSSRLAYIRTFYSFNNQQNNGRYKNAYDVSSISPYGHSEENWNLLMEVCGRPGLLDRFVQLEQRPGTDIHFFYDFIYGITLQIGPGTPGNRRCFTMDNLAAHKHLLAVLNLIMTSGHRFDFQAPYYPVDGPIEYAFHTLQYQVSLRMVEIYNNASL
jgi:hypothetical protein